MTNKLRHSFATVATTTVAVALGALLASAEEPKIPEFSEPFGHNEERGQRVKLNGIEMYYEIYGQGPPMLMIHGNGGYIATMGHQIECFSPKYQVIVADSRGHGNSEMGSDVLTYELMAEDANALLEHLSLEKVSVLGWSDGGNIGLLLAMNHPEKVGKLAVMGANINPRGAHDYAFSFMTEMEQQIDERIAAKDESQPWEKQKQYVQLLTKHPNIAVDELKRVKAPTLVLAGDRDIIRNAHTLEIFEGLPHAQLCIFPGATHMIPWQDPERFNPVVERFFEQPFTRPDSKGMFQMK